MDARYARIGAVSRRLGGAFVLDRFLPRDNVRVVMTHFVPREDFEQFGNILDCLSTKRQWLDPSQFLRQTAEGSPLADINGQSLMLTFDDGLLSSYEAAKLILQPRGIRAMFFVPTKILDLSTRSQMRDFVAENVYYGRRSRRTLRAEEYVTMAAEQLRELQEAGHAILSHTHTHVMVRDITSRREAARELIHPKRILEDLLGSPVDALALPVGTPATVSASAYREIASTYSVCFTALGGANTSTTDPLFIRRDSIHPWYSVEHARNIVDGLYDPYFGLRAKALRRRAGRTGGSRSTECPADGAPNPSSDARARFVRQVARAFREANVDYVVLHGDRDHRDSDLDLALSRRSLDVADAVIRSGALGRVVQCLHYDVPWCRYYVLQAEEPDRWYRQLDIVCDPWGIGKYGATVRTALSHAVLTGEVRVPTPAAETLYLAAKRARKKTYDTTGSIDDLEHAFWRDPIAAAELLETHFGSAGRRLASSLWRDSDVGGALAQVRRRLTRRRRTPRILARRASFTAQRVTQRLAQPSGLVVSIVGEADQSNSLLVAGVQCRTEGAFRRTLTLLPDRRADGHRPLGSGVFVASLLDALIHWWPRVLLARARSTLVLVGQGLPELAVGPRRYRAAVPAGVPRLLGRLLPRPDLTICLTRPAALTSEHMAHVESEETTRNRHAWRRPLVREPGQFVLIENSRPPEVILERVVTAINDCLAARQRRP